MAKITYKISECWRYGPQFEDEINKGFKCVVEITLMRGGKDYRFFHSKEGCDRFVSSQTIHGESK